MKTVSAYLAMLFAVASLAAVGCSGATPPPSPAKAPTSLANTAEPVGVQPTRVVSATQQPTEVATKQVNYPVKGKPITIIVPWAAGSVNDLFSRQFASWMEKELGTSVQVVDKAGASGQLGIAELALAKPDGYTLAMNVMPTTAITYLDPDRKSSFFRKDLEPVAVAAMEPPGLVVKGDSPYKTTDDLVKAAKAAPEKVKVGDNGVMTAVHLAALGLSKAADAKFAHVHFNGSGEQVAAMLGGHIDAGVVSAGGLMGQFSSGALRILGVFDKEESVLFPGAKPLPAQGYNVTMSSSRGFVAPGGTPKPVIELLSGVIGRATKDSEFRKKMEEMGVLVRFADAQEYARLWVEDEAKIGPMLEDAKAVSK